MRNAVSNFRRKQRLRIVAGSDVELGLMSEGEVFGAQEVWVAAADFLFRVTNSQLFEITKTTYLKCSRDSFCRRSAGRLCYRDESFPSLPALLVSLLADALLPCQMVGCLVQH